MTATGQGALFLALVAALYSIAASIAGSRLEHRRVMRTARFAALGVFLSMSAAIAIFASLVVAGQDQEIPIYFKISSVWGSEHGSLLLWSWLLTVIAAVVVLQNWRVHTAMMSHVIAILMTGAAFFVSLLVWTLNPFQTAEIVKPDGFQLNAMLRDWRMLLHPPLLYLGFSSFLAPFAFTMGALIVREPSSGWLQSARRWAVIAWLFLSAGILLGANWAYHRLGWGGFWAWDPVENGALMPWLIGAAYVHSIITQDVRNILKTWNAVLAALAFLLSMFGGFLSRSGLVLSIHAFAQSPAAGYFLAVMSIVFLSAVYLIFSRRRYLRSDTRIGSLASVEVVFVFANLFLLAVCFAVLWGTMLPALSEWITGQRIHVAAPWFNRVIPPIAIVLLVLMSAGALLAWRRSLMARSRRYAGYVVQLGFVLLFLGGAGQAFKEEDQFEAKVGETFRFHQYSLKLDDLRTVTERNYSVQRASVSVLERGRSANTILPERRVYNSDGHLPVTEAAVWERPSEDLYLVFAGISADGERATFLAFLNPLVVWIWIGGVVLIGGALIALLREVVHQREIPLIS